MMRKTSLKGFMKVSFEVGDLKGQRWGVLFWKQYTRNTMEMKLRKLSSI